MMVLDLDDQGVAKSTLTMDLAGIDPEILVDILLGLDGDVLLSEDLEPELREILVNNNVRVALTKSRCVLEALRDLFSGRVDLSPPGSPPIRYAN